MTLYGIPNCNTVKEARAWFTLRGIEMPFHDFKKHGLTRQLLEAWLQRTTWETLVNRKGLTWRKLADDEKQAVCDAQSAIELMLRHPSVIKRPVLEANDQLVIGFEPERYATIFESH